MIESLDRAQVAKDQRRSFVVLVIMFIAIQVVILALAFGAIWLVNQTRAYAAGEGLYSKGQKQAVYALQRYAFSSNPADFEEFQRRIQVPIGDRKARQALQQNPPDLPAARAGLLQGENHPADIPGMIRMFLWFSETALFSKAVESWEEADELIKEIVIHADQLHRAIVEGHLGDDSRSQLIDEIYELDQEITELQDAFSRQMGISARQVRDTVVVLLIIASILLWTGSVTYGRKLHLRGVAAELALARREQRLRSIMNGIADSIVRIEPSMHIERFNRATGQMFGMTTDQLRRGDPSELVVPEDRKTLMDSIRFLLDSQDVPDGRQQLSLEGMRSDGSRFPMEVSFTREAEGPERGLILTLRDVTERRAMENKLFQSQKMESVGQLTGGIAHDFNNLLTVVIGNLEALEEASIRDQDPDEVSRYVSSAMSAAERGARLTSDLLSFSRRQPLSPAPVNIDDLIHDMREILVRTMTEAVLLELDLNAGDVHAMVDRAQLESALLNLALNARHAMPDGGRLTIATNLLDFGLDNLMVDELEPGAYISIKVIDSGCGIPATDMDRVFEPFFTTRDVGEGSGLGLSMVHGFVRQSGGAVRLDSDIGKGTRMEILLPVVAQDRPVQDKTPIAGTGSGGHEESLP
jgi:PAS domain S-box-containing protein